MLAQSHPSIFGNGSLSLRSCSRVLVFFLASVAHILAIQDNAMQTIPHVNALRKSSAIREDVTGTALNTFHTNFSRDIPHGRSSDDDIPSLEGGPGATTHSEESSEKRPLFGKDVQPPLW